MNKTPSKRILPVKIFFGLFLAAGLCTVYIIFYFPDYAKLRKIRAANQKIVSQIHGLRKEIKKLDEDNSRLGNDSSFYEKLAREKLDVAKDGEIVIDIKE